MKSGADDKSAEKKARTDALRDLIRRKFSAQLNELIALLKSEKEGILLEEAAKKIGTTPQGIRDIIASTGFKNVEIFQKEDKKPEFIKLK